MRRATCPRARAAGATRAAWCSCAELHPVDPTGNRQQLPRRSPFGSLMVELADGGNWADGTPPWWMRKTGIPIRRLSLMNWSLQVDRMTLLSKLDLSISPKSVSYGCNPCSCVCNSVSQCRVFFSSSISYVQLEIAVSKRYLQYW